mmetsp:Transcript_30300/g.34542  ORF Transcript_30300/g.34542 Transcript_30300/m.34542 type:complete len:438 (+) Transcript_30300:38-1351(+)
MTTRTTFVQQFGDELINPSNNRMSIVKPSKALEGKEIIILYFCGHWCPPQRQLTPTLNTLYRKLVRRQKPNKKFEIIYCSLDYDRKNYMEFIKTMPWLCMPFQSPLSRKMAKQYNAKGIPHLVIIDAMKNYRVITVDGVHEVRSDPNGINFPWKPKTFQQIWPNKILTPASSLWSSLASKKTIDSSTLEDKYLMLYFSAHWRPTCRRLTTPRLSEFYNKMREERKDFELVFISSDHNERSFREYFSTMTFCAVPYIFRDTYKELAKKYNVKTIPSLVMLGPMMKNGERPVINPNVRGFLDDGDTSSAIKEFPFRVQKYGSIARAPLNDERCVLLFHENGSSHEQAKIKDIIQQAAIEIEKNTNDKSTTDIKIYWSLEMNGIGAKVRSALKMPPTTIQPTMILLDIPDNGGYYKSEEEKISVDSIQNFILSPGKRFQI